ncbi:hypothetical protein DSUL_100046 [Desulfovibrionales bacterium]
MFMHNSIFNVTTTVSINVVIKENIVLRLSCVDAIRTTLSIA